MTTPAFPQISTNYISAVLDKLHPTFRTRTYRSGERVVFMTIKNAKWNDLYPAALDPVTAGRYPGHNDLLSYTHLSEIVRLRVPGARMTSGGVGGGTWRLPPNIIHRTGTIPRKSPDQAYRKLYKFHITIIRQDQTVRRHEEKGKGSQDPTVSLRSAFAALGQLIQPGDRNFTFIIKNRGSGKIVIQSPVINLEPTL